MRQARLQSSARRMVRSLNFKQTFKGSQASNYKNLIDGQGPILLPMDVRQAGMRLPFYYVATKQKRKRIPVVRPLGSNIGPFPSINFL